jgi:hypothetical protein
MNAQLTSRAQRFGTPQVRRGDHRTFGFGSPSNCKNGFLKIINEVLAVRVRPNKVHLTGLEPWPSRATKMGRGSS